MQTVNPSPAAIEAFQSFYLGRVQRVGAITLKKGSAALFFEPTEAVHPGGESAQRGRGQCL
jgi:hypothetical protein